MNLLADENFPSAAVEMLRSAGHDVVWVRTACPGISDQDVLARATTEKRILITFDKDFGDLAFRSGLFWPGKSHRNLPGVRFGDRRTSNRVSLPAKQG